MKLTDAVSDRLATFRLSSDAFQQAVATHLNAVEDKLQRQHVNLEDARADSEATDRISVNASIHIQALLTASSTNGAVRQSTGTLAISTSCRAIYNALTERIDRQ